MSSLAAQEILASGSLTVQEQALAGRIRQALLPAAEIPGLTVELHSAAGARCTLLGNAGRNAEAPFARFRADSVNGAELAVYAPQSDPAARKLIEIAVRSLIETVEVEKREELLLEELGANWESLEALYEISTDVLRFGSIKDALRRLINRFTSLQEGLHATLFSEKNGALEPFAECGTCVQRIDWKDLDPIAKPIQEGHTVVLNDFAAHSLRQPNFCWANAIRLAAAPVRSRESVIGLLIVWREDLRSEFDSPFSRLMEAMTHQASMLLESERLHRTVLENERLAQEIEIASSIQQTLLLGNPPTDVPGLEVSSFSVASQQIDGDFHDFLQHPDGSVDVLIGDVMGKGVAAALLGAATKSQFLRSLSNLALDSRGETPRPVDIVRRAASSLGERLISLDRFVTLLYARFDLSRRLMEFVDCGHTGILLHRKQTGEAMFLRGDDLPVGVETVYQCEQHAFTILPGDTLLFYSDGVTETRNSEGEFFGEERLVEAVRTWSSLGPKLLIEQIRKDAAEFGAHDKFADDFTCIAVRIRLTAENEPLGAKSAELSSDLQEISRMRSWLQTWASAASLDEVSVSQLELACTEAFVNAVLHGGPPPVRLKALIYEHHVTIEMRHKGPAFNPLNVPPPSFDGSKDTGFGTYIIFRSADELRYEREESGTNLISISISRKKESSL